MSTIGCTSFFPSKPLGCYGDGGAIFTNDDELATAMRQIRVHGQARRYEHVRIGVGGRMDTLQCAIVLAKLERFGWEVERRGENGSRYNRLLEGRIPFVAQRPDRSSVFAQYTVFVDDRETVRTKMQASGIPTAVHYPIPLNQQPAYARFGEAVATPVATAVANRVMSLPMSADLDDASMDRVISSLLAATSGVSESR